MSVQKPKFLQSIIHNLLVRLEQEEISLLDASISAKKILRAIDKIEEGDLNKAKEMVKDLTNTRDA